MYSLPDLAGFALAEFARGLEGLTDDEARARLPKADGTQMNSISWTAGHLAWHWLGVARIATGAPRDPDVARFANGSSDPTPPSLAEAIELLARTRESTAWIATADDAMLGRYREGADPATSENLGTALMRVILHTWFHTGEVNAIRQMLGHPEILFVGRMLGALEWRASTQPSQSVPAIGAPAD